MLEEENYTLQGAKNKLTEERRGVRAGGGAAAKKRVKSTATIGEELTAREYVPVNDTADGVNNGGWNDKALLLNIRDELSEVLRLLKT
jgi:hypothetical protein